MSRILIVDALASRYHLLPSEVLARADSVDVYIMDASLAYRKYAEEEEQHLSNGGPAPVGNIPQKKLEEMISRVRKKNENKHNKNAKQN